MRAIYEKPESKAPAKSSTRTSTQKLMEFDFQMMFHQLGSQEDKAQSVKLVFLDEFDKLVAALNQALHPAQLRDINLPVVIKTVTSFLREILVMQGGYSLIEPPKVRELRYPELLRSVVSQPNLLKVLGASLIKLETDNWTHF